MKLLIGVPTHDYLHVDFMKCLIALLDHLKEQGVDYTLRIESGTMVHMARDKIACRAINEKYTHVLWLDSDMIFKPHILEDLQECGKDFVTGIAHGRRPPHPSCVFKQIMPPKRFEEYPLQPFQVAGCGMACVLINTDILRAVQNKNGTCFTPMVNIGEDLAFCMRARELGFEIWAEPMVRLGHIGHIHIYPEAYDDWKQTISNIESVTIK